MTRRGATALRAWVLLLVAACASAPTIAADAGADAAPRSPADCEALEDEAVLACVRGYHATVERPAERSVRFVYALRHACPYAGAVARSGCQRDAYARFVGRSAHGSCGDRIDYIESAIFASCLRPIALPFEQWNALTRECIAWAEAGADERRATCGAPRRRSEAPVPREPRH